VLVMTSKKYSMFPRFFWVFCGFGSVLKLDETFHQVYKKAQFQERLLP